MRWVSCCFMWLVYPKLRWLAKICMIDPDTVYIPLKITNVDGDEFESICPATILWPWDFFNFLWESGQLFRWIADDGKAPDRVQQYWTRCKHLDFFHGLIWMRRSSILAFLYFHTDGVKIYKNQKAWIYSYAAATRKGTSIKTKSVFLLFRDHTVVKGKTHDSVGKTGCLYDECFENWLLPNMWPWQPTIPGRLQASSPCR